MLKVEDIVVSPPADDERFDPRRWFVPETPVELEIGCGKGGFLVTRSTAVPDHGLLGVEWSNPYFKFAADRMARRGITNVRIMRTDAARLVIRQLVPDCLSALHVYHPDPWPKKRHHKRRLFQPPFITAAAAALRLGALWWIQTDHAEYFEWIRLRMSGQPLLEAVPFETQRGDTVDPSTNFQMKYLRDGRTIFRLAYRKLSPMP